MGSSLCTAIINPLGEEASSEISFTQSSSSGFVTGTEDAAWRPEDEWSYFNPAVAAARPSVANINVERFTHQSAISQAPASLKMPLLSLSSSLSLSKLLASTESTWEWPFEQISDLNFIGSGAQGVVFRGILNGQPIAVKKVQKQSETDIRHLRNLRHPNIVRFIGVCVQSPCYCVLMEYCPNGQLYDLLHNGLPVSPGSIASWTKQIANGMHYLHSNKVVHRDLKSPNVLIGADGSLKISDFGVAKEFTENSTKMSFAGTVAWMAPEIMRNDPCSFKVDVW
nr:unnamed protein product [Spirometra erinaceieuropaei]